MNASSVLRAKALVALGVVLAFSIACSSEAATHTPDPTQEAKRIAELQEFIAERFCDGRAVLESGKRPIVLACVKTISGIDWDAQSLNRVMPEYATRAWQCREDGPVEVENREFERVHFSGGPNLTGYFTLGLETASKAEAILCEGDWYMGGCEQWLLTKRNGQWEMERGTGFHFEKEAPHLEPRVEWNGEARAWVDANSNGNWDNTEKPLAGVRFQMEAVYSSGQKSAGTEVTSDQEGIAIFESYGVCNVDGECPDLCLHAKAPPGFRPTTQDRICRYKSEVFVGFTYIDTPTPEPTATPSP